MVAFQYTLPAGIPGTVNRIHDATVLAEILHTTLYPTLYGTVVCMDAATGTIRAPATADVVFDGLYSRPYPTQSGQDPLGTSTPPTAAQQPVGNVLKRGFMSVQLRGASAAAKGQQANVWTGAPAGGQVPGGITAVAPAAGSCVVLPGAFFRGPADAGGFTEIEYNL
jgi:hypothetical protein